jgi:kynurenine formamidase
METMLLRWLPLLLLGSTSLPAQLRMDHAAYDRLMKEVSNWNRWGADDQKGTVNLITPAKRKSAVLAVKDGISVSLSRDADTVRSLDNPNPFGFAMGENGLAADAMFATDTFTISHHGLAMTHFDSLSHVFYQGRMYNGHPQQEVNQQGAQKLAVTAFKDGFVTRGVLMDIPRLKGQKYLDLSTQILPADLEAWEKKAGIRVGSGDAIFIRTGRWARRAEKGPYNTETAGAGLHVSCARWLRERGVALIGADNNAEFMPSPVEGVDFPMHRLLIVAMGMPMFDNCDLEALSVRAATLGRWEFLFTASTLAVPGGTGSAVNPIATF